MSKLVAVGILGVLVVFLGLLSKQVDSALEDPKKKQEGAAPQISPDALGKSGVSGGPSIPMTEQEKQRLQQSKERQQREQLEMMKTMNSDKAKKERAFEEDRTLKRAALEAKDKSTAPKHPAGNMDLSGDWSVRRKPGQAGMAALEERHKEDEAERAAILNKALKMEQEAKAKAVIAGKSGHSKEDGHNH